MEISASLVKDLRERTGAGMMDCKKALVETGGDLEKAIDVLRKRGLAAAAKKAGRTTSEGAVGSYIHAGGKIGVLVEVNCETDFVARNQEFQQLVVDLAMHIAAAAPRYLRREDVPAEVLEREREVYRGQVAAEGKPAHIVDKIVDGKVGRFFSENCLFEQAFVKDPDLTITQLVTGKISKLGENIQVARYARYRLGEAGSGADPEAAA